MEEELIYEEMGGDSPPNQKKELEIWRAPEIFTGLDKAQTDNFWSENEKAAIQPSVNFSLCAKL